MEVFRFLDLAAELRNRVYEEALTHDRANGRVATVALLRTCRQINDEAKNIIYEQSSFTIFVKSTGCFHGLASRSCGPHSPRFMTFSGDAVGTFDLRAEQQPDIKLALPQEMLQVSKINIQLEITVVSPPTSDDIRQVRRIDEPARQLLDVLQDVLNSERKQRQVSFTVPNNYFYKGRTNRAWIDFSGLAWLRPWNELKICGLEDEVIGLLQNCPKE